MKIDDLTSGTLYHLAAFTNDPQGGNPAGVWIGDTLPAPLVMQQIAVDVGFSETAFIAPRTGKQRTVRYYSPEAEVAFCGHATIASAVTLGDLDGEGNYLFNTKVGEIPVDVTIHNEHIEASLTSVLPVYAAASNELLNKTLKALNWALDDLEPSIPPARAFAGNWHLVLAVKSKERLDNLSYDFDTLKSIMQADDLTTLQLIWQESPEVIHSRNPFPIGGVVEDPATGSAAVALGGYLRDANLIAAPATLQIRQGEVMGRPSLLIVTIPETGGISVSGTAVKLTPKGI
jgi:PhzF family phenazine biosynthesis protein